MAARKQHRKKMLEFLKSPVGYTKGIPQKEEGAVEQCYVFKQRRELRSVFWASERFWASGLYFEIFVLWAIRVFPRSL